MNPTEYKDLQKSFLERTFCFKQFKEFNVKDKCQVILGQDDDFSVDMALQMTTLEKVQKFLN